MLRETKWLVAALAAALWAAPGAAQTGSSGQQTSGEQGTVQGSTNPRAEPARGGSGPSANSAQTGSPEQESMGTGSAPAGSTSEEQRTQQGTSEGTSTSPPTSASTRAGTAGQKAKAMGQQATSDVARTLAKIHAGNESEIEAGTWMKEHATNDRVKDFAKKMVDEHGSLDKDLMSYAQKNGIDLTSAPTTGEATKATDTASMEKIKAMQGAQSDRAYMKMMVDDHTRDVKDVRSAEHQAKQAKNDEFAKLLDKSAKKMESHLHDAKKIEHDLSQRQARNPAQ